MSRSTEKEARQSFQQIKLQMKQIPRFRRCNAERTVSKRNGVYSWNFQSQLFVGIALGHIEIA